MKFIEHIVEPQRLLLSWQPPSSLARGRCIVAELRRKDSDADLVYLRESDDYRRAVANGFREYPGFPADRNHPAVLAAFLRRLPPRHRDDFGEFLNAIRIPPNVEVSDFALLGYAGAKLPSDDFVLIHPFNDAQPPFEFLLLVAGYRYYTDRVPVSAITPGMPVRFEAERQNAVDPEAIRVILPDVANATAGYVSRGLLPQFRRWLSVGWRVTATVERLNGTSEYPLVYLYVEVRLP